MGIINEEILRLLIKYKNVVLIGSVDPTGVPNISPRFVLSIFGGDRLLFADAFVNKTYNNTLSWPKATAAILDIDSTGGYQLKGDVEEIKDHQLILEATVKLKEFFGKDITPIRVWALHVKEIYSLIPNPKSKRPIYSAYY